MLFIISLEILSWSEISPLKNEYLSYCSFAVERHHDQGSSYKKACDWRLAYNFRGLVHDHHCKKQTGWCWKLYILTLRQQICIYRETGTGMGSCFFSNSMPHNTPLPTRPHHTKQFHQLGIKHANIWV